MQKQFNQANGCLNSNEWFDLDFFWVQSSIKEVLFIHLCYSATRLLMVLMASTVMIILNLIIKFKIIITVEAIKTMSSLVAL